MKQEAPVERVLALCLIRWSIVDLDLSATLGACQSVEQATLVNLFGSRTEKFCCRYQNFFKCLLGSSALALHLLTCGSFANPSSSFLLLVKKQIFLSFFKTLVGKEIAVELKNDVVLTGTLHSVDQYLNIKLLHVKIVNPEKYPQLTALQNCFIRGSVVRYIQIPPEHVDTELLQDAARKENAPPSASGGGGGSNKAEAAASK